jgi:UDP-4-amino-4,6-dideoxy-N-acetyl-beta-L-altrosamine transaminase
MSRSKAPSRAKPSRASAESSALTDMQNFLPYGRQVVDDEDIAAVSEVLRGDWLTTGPAVSKFEAALAEAVGADDAVVCSSGTAALYLAARAAHLQPGDAVVVPAITFVATANAAVLAGLEVVFADVDPNTGLMGVEHAMAALDRRGGPPIKAIIPVHLGGRVENPAELQSFAAARGLIVIEDACHALGTSYGNGSQRVGGCAHSSAACFSFHPVKMIAMGEGGAVTTNSREFAAKVRLLRNHGLCREQETWVDRTLGLDSEGVANSWYYEVREISHNLRASDLNCALGASQLRKLQTFVEKRRSLMARYRRMLLPLAPAVQHIANAADTEPGWHLCSVLIDFEGIGVGRQAVMHRLKARGIGTQVHYIPVHMQPFYRDRYGHCDLPGARRYYERGLTLPLFPAMTDDDVDRVVAELAAIVKGGGASIFR